MIRTGLKSAGCAVLLAMLTMALTAGAQEAPNWLAGKELLHALQQGGYVLVMRHASSPRTPPTKDIADADNPQLERQLDAAGRDSARALGESIRKLDIPIGKVLVSPTYRARLTAALAGFKHAQAVRELGDNGHLMQGIDASQANWLRAQAIQPPPRHSNTLMITQLPNVVAAFGNEWSDLREGEALVLHPDGKGSVITVARIGINEWAALGR